MANRFLETNYYKSPFVRSLKGSIKGLYSFIICDCTPAGIWSMDMEAASMYIGFNVIDKDFVENFVERGKAVDIGGGKFFFPDFIEHQYPKGLQETNAAHKNIIFELKKFELLDEKNQVKLKKNKAPLKPLGSPLIDPTNRGQGNGIGNGIGEGIGEGIGNTGNGSSKNFIVPQMCELWYATFTSYTRDDTSDLDGMGKVLQFITKQAKNNNIADCDYHVKILNTLQLIADQVNNEPFWVNKPIKSIANHIQEFYNHIKNPLNGKSKPVNGSNGSQTFREKVQAKFNDRVAQG